MSPRLEVRGLSVAVAGRPVVDGLDFAVAPGEVAGLVGRSGSGKSLTARALVGLPPRGVAVTGSVRLDGRELLGLPERELRRLRGQAVGLVFQEPSTALDPVMPVRAQVAEGLVAHRLARGSAAGRAAAAELEAVGLPPTLAAPSRRPHQLSGGQRQRAALAAALALKPRLLIADEPTTALDPITAAAVIDLLVARARGDGSSLLLISHDLALLARVADRLLVLEGGRIATTVRPSEAGEALTALAGGQTEASRQARPAVIPDGAADPGPRSPPLAPGPGSAPRSGRDDRGWAASPPPVLQARGLTRLYPGARRAGVEGIELELRPGERLAVVGETGAGKSTLLRLLLGLERPDAGEVRLAGEPFNPAPPASQRALRTRIQPVFQDPAGSFDPRWSAGRIVAEPLALLRLSPAETQARVAQALEAVGLAPADAERPARAFSGGQRQRLALARALVVEPAVLLLDEATSALDPASRAEILQLLVRLGEARGTACLAVTHDIALVRAFADRVLVLKDGQVVEASSAQRLVDAPEHPYTRALVAAAPDLPTVLAMRAAAGPQA